MSWLTPEVANLLAALVGAILGALGGHNRGSASARRKIHQDPSNTYVDPKLPRVTR